MSRVTSNRWSDSEYALLLRDAEYNEMTVAELVKRRALAAYVAPTPVIDGQRAQQALARSAQAQRDAWLAKARGKKPVRRA